jgi:predicted aspartyl protease
MIIKLRNKHTGVLRIHVKFWVPEKKAFARATAIFDTGAYRTILDERLAELLQLPLNDEARADTVTASGMVKTFNSTLPSLSMGSMTILGIPISVMRLPDELKTRCIIGMNVLQEFDIAISNYDGTVTLTPKPLPKKYFVEDYSITLASVEDGGTQEEDTA